MNYGDPRCGDPVQEPEFRAKPCRYLGQCGTDIACSTCSRYEPAPDRFDFRLTPAHLLKVAEVDVLDQQAPYVEAPVVLPVVRRRLAPREWSGRNFRKARE